MSGTVRAPMPPGGWPPAPCHRWRDCYSAHGWIGPASGRLYWCGPAARAFAQALMDGTAKALLDRPED